MGAGSLNSVERATINASGALGRLAISTAMVSPRAAHATVVVGNYLYVLGGITQAGSTNLVLSSVERARIDADGLLGPFATVTGITLSAPRSYHTAAVIGNSVYVIGGIINNTTTSNSVERASIANDGTLETFVPVPGITLTSPRNSHTSAIVGNYLYVLGGFTGSNLLDSVERASIAADGSLGPFELATGISLMTGLVYHRSAVIGNHLYIIGGSGSSGSLNVVERASIAADGSLGAFAQVPGVALTTPRAQHTAAVAGKYLYVFGGVNGSRLDSVESAAIAPDGSLGSFAPVLSLALTTTRQLHTTAVVQDYLYVLGGDNQNGFLNSVEQALLNTDGSQ
jgi:N-acetylneuraminic acid mutarotase